MKSSASDFAEARVFQIDAPYARAFSLQPLDEVAADEASRTTYQRTSHSILRLAHIPQHGSPNDGAATATLITE